MLKAGSLGVRKRAHIQSHDGYHVTSVRWSILSYDVFFLDYYHKMLSSPWHHGAISPRQQGRRRGGVPSGREA
jgi:hypothetical protein